MLKPCAHFLALTALCSALLLAYGDSHAGSGDNNPPIRPLAPPRPMPASPGSLEFDVSNVTVDENARAAILTVTRKGGSDGIVSVTVMSSDGSATAVKDYTALATTVIFAARDADTKTVMISLTDDSEVEPTETLSVTLSAPTGGATLGPNSTATITIRDNDTISPPPQPGSLQFDVGSLSVGELAGTAILTITRIGGTDGAVDVTVTSSDGSATAGQDYAPLSTTVSFADGDAAAKTVTVPITNDFTAEADETLSVALSAPTGGAVLGANAAATVTILDDDPPNTPTLRVQSDLKRLIFTWQSIPFTTSYRLLQNLDGVSGFTQVGPDHPANATSTTLDIAVHRHNWMNTLYRLEAVNEHDSTGSLAINAAPAMLQAIGYFKASNTTGDDFFGHSVAISADGRTLAVGAPTEDGTAVGINGDQNAQASATSNLGAVYVFTRPNAAAQWSQQAYVKASNTGVGDRFGTSLALSADGNTLAVGAINEDSNAIGVDNASNPSDDRDQGNNSAQSAGAAYVFARDSNGTWAQQAYVKPSNTGALDFFGTSVALSNDGGTLAVGAPGEASALSGVGAGGPNEAAPGAGAVYVFVRAGTTWLQQIYIKAQNPDIGDAYGTAVALSGDGSTLAVGATQEDSPATGVNGNQGNTNTQLNFNAGAVYTYFRAPFTNWAFQTYVKASNTGQSDQFGSSLALNANGTTLAVGAHRERSSATGVNGNQNDDSLVGAGAVYVLTRPNVSTPWAQQAYVKASNTGLGDEFGTSLALSADGNMLAVGAELEDSNAMGIDGDQNNDSGVNAGAVYTFRRDQNAAWSQQAYVKPSNTQRGPFFGGSFSFGCSLGLSADGNILAVGANVESSNARGVGGNQNDTSAPSAGAVYMY
jgi:hypothetical protein